MATSKLQRHFGDMLDNKFPEYTIRENYRPDWMISSDLTKLELDFYIEELNIAFEVQGDQHFKFIPFFHKTIDDYEKRKRHDEEKRELCRGRNIRLIEICTETDAIIAVKDIKEKYCQQPKYFYQILEAEHLTSKQRRKKRELEKTRIRKEKSLLRKFYKNNYSEQR